MNKAAACKNMFRPATNETSLFGIMIHGTIQMDGWGSVGLTTSVPTSASASTTDVK